MEKISELINNYFETIGVIPNGTRQTDQVYARSAMMVAMRDYMTLMHIGRIFGKNHATIHHAVKNHEINHNWSSLYRFFYATAKELLLQSPVEEIRRDNRLQAQFTRQQMRIVELEHQNNKMLTDREQLTEEIAILRKYKKLYNELIEDAIRV